MNLSRLILLILNLILLCQKCCLTQVEKIFSLDLFDYLVNLEKGSNLNSGLISSKCSNSLQLIKEGLQNGELWSYKLLDSSSKSLNGFLKGNFLFLGDYYQCVDIYVKDKNNRLISKGKYFLLSLVPITRLTNETNLGLDWLSLDNSNQNIQTKLDHLFRFPEYINLKLGLCLTDECNNTDIQRLANKYLAPFNLKIQKNINSQVKSSLLNEFFEKNLYFKFSLTIILLILSLVFSSTLIELFASLIGKKQSNQIITCFSLKSNLIKLHTSDTNSEKLNIASQSRSFSEKSTNFLHIIVFVPIFKAQVVNENLFDWVQNANKPLNQIIYAESYYAGLMILASFTISLKLIQMITNKENENVIFLNIFKRILSFWPIFLVLICIQICMSTFLNGPLVKELVEPLGINCERNWWKNLLFIHNLFDTKDICLIHTWTISAELQLFLLANLLTYVYIKKESIAIILNLALILIGFIYNFLIVYYEYANPNIVSFPFYYEKFYTTLRWSHIHTLSHISTYFIVYLAIYWRLIKKTFKVSFQLRSCVTLVLVFYFISTLFSGAIYNCFGFSKTKWLNIVYFIYNKSAFSLLVCWLILSYFPNGEPNDDKKQIKYILSKLYSKKSLKNITKIEECKKESVEKSETFKIIRKEKNFTFSVGKKLTRSVYFSHYFYLVYALLNITRPHQMDSISFIITVQSILFWIYPISYVFHLFIEGPITNFSFLLIKYLVVQKKEETKNE